MSQRTLKSHGFPSDILSSLRQILLAPLSSVVIIFIITFALFLATFFYLLWTSNDRINIHLNESARISLFLKKKVNTKAAVTLVEKLRQDPKITKVELVRPDEGIKTFTENTGLGALLSNIKENPLPNVVIIYPQIKILTKHAASEFSQKLKNQTEVEIVKEDLNWIEQIHDWLHLWDTLSLVLMLALIINAILLIIGISYTTTKISIFKHNIAKTIIIYQFTWLCLLSSSLAVLLIRSLTLTLQNHDILMPSLNPSCSVIIICSSMFLGFLGARIAGAKKETRN